MSNNGPATCCGTQDDSTIWCNSTDFTGLSFSLFVLTGIAFCTIVVIVINISNDMALYDAVIIFTLIFMALWSHLRTMLGDPGSVPSNAHPLLENVEVSQIVCGRCECYKRPMSHHDRVSKRCISRMDHFCPWMNNAIGAKNQKNFFLFLIYTDLVAIYTYFVIVFHLIDCDGTSCTQYTEPALDMARVLIFLLLFAVLFTSSMIINQIYGLTVGLGTIDRMKLKDDELAEGKPVPFTHVFGDWWPAYFLPLDPVFTNPEEVFHYRLSHVDYCRKT